MIGSPETWAARADEALAEGNALLLHAMFMAALHDYIAIREFVADTDAQAEAAS